MGDKHCFYCQIAFATTRNPLKETAGGNFIHKECLNHTKWLEPYTEGTLVPKFKRKSKKEK